MKLFHFFTAAAFAVTCTSAVAAVTPSGLNRSRQSNSVTITATGTAATLDGVAFPLNTATVVNSIGYHELSNTDGGVTTVYRFLVRNSARGSTEDGIPTMVPYRLVQDAPSAFDSGVLQIMAPAVYPRNLPVPVVATLTKGPSHGPLAGDPHFLNGILRASNYAALPVQVRRGWGSTILPGSPTAGSKSFDARLHSLSHTAPIIYEATTVWTPKSGTLGGSEDWGSQARIDMTGNVIIPAGVTVTIGQGTVVRCAPNAEIWVRPGGSLLMNGTPAAPVVLVPADTNVLWGGIWLQPQSGANVATLTATGTIFCAWGASRDWYTAPAGEPTRNFPHHRSEQPCIAVATGATATLTDCALVGPTGVSQTRAAMLATNGGSLIFNRVLMQRGITGGEQENCPTFTMNSCAILELSNTGLDVDGPGFVDADNDGIYLVPRGKTFNLSKCVIGWTKDDGIDSGGDGNGTVTCRNCWFENCIHEAFSNSGVGRVPESIDGVHINCGQGMECGYGGPLTYLERTLLVGNMVGARYGDNYGSNSGNNGTGTSQYDGSVNLKDSYALYNIFHDTWAIDFSRWAPRNQVFTMTGTKVSKTADLAAQNGTEDSGNSLWNAATDGGLIATYMPTPGSEVGMDFPQVERQTNLSAWPTTFTVRLSTFSSQTVTAQWKAAGRATPEAETETTLATGTLTFLPGETVKTYTMAAPAGTGYGLITMSLDSPVNAATTGTPLWYFPPGPPPPPNQVLIAKSTSGWAYHAALTPGGWTTSTPWPALDAGGAVWTSPIYTTAAPWYTNAAAPIGWGPIGPSGSLLPLATSITERPITVYARRTFTVADPAAVTGLILEVLADDGASAYINGVRVSPTDWGLNSGTNVGGALYYNQLSTRFKDNNDTEKTYDVLTLTGANMPTLNAAPALNVLAIEVHQNSTDSSDCVLDGSITASFAPPATDAWGTARTGGESYLYWTGTWQLETSANGTDWQKRTDTVSPVKIVTDAQRLFYHLVKP